MRTDKKPSSDVAQPMPSSEYTTHVLASVLIWYSFEEPDLLCTVKSGNTAPKVYLKIPFAAIALAPFSEPYTSVIYSAALVYFRQPPLCKINNTGHLQTDTSSPTQTAHCPPAQQPNARPAPHSIPPKISPPRFPNSPSSRCTSGARALHASRPCPLPDGAWLGR